MMFAEGDNAPALGNPFPWLGRALNFSWKPSLEMVFACMERLRNDPPLKTSYSSKNLLI